MTSVIKLRLKLVIVPNVNRPIHCIVFSNSYFWEPRQCSPRRQLPQWKGLLSALLNSKIRFGQAENELCVHDRCLLPGIYCSIKIIILIYMVVCTCKATPQKIKQVTSPWINSMQVLELTGW
jgi:hypothetical protein